MFDQRNSGTSGGDICTYGYLEWQDVLGAIAIVRQISVTTDVILFGIGTGCTSSLMAYANLPPEGANENTLVQYSQEIRNLGFDKSYVIGMIGTNFSLAAEIARLPIPVLILYGGHDTFVGADKIDQIISERNRLNSTITRSVMVSGAGYLEEYSINKNLYIDTVNNFLNSLYMLEEN